MKKVIQFSVFSRQFLVFSMQYAFGIFSRLFAEGSKQFSVCNQQLTVNRSRLAVLGSLLKKTLPTSHCLLKTTYCLLLTLFTVSIQAQEQDSIAPQESIAMQDSQIAMMARPQKDGRILLRWGVTTAKAWRKLNRYGYELKRYTISRNRKTLPLPVEKLLGVFKPKPVEEWMAVIEENDNAAVMAQSLYGEGFDVEGINGLSAIVNLAEEQEQRFTWGLYAADQDYSVAKMAGLAFIDDMVIQSEKYVYKITSLVPESELAIKEGGVFVGLEEYEALPKPLDVSGVFLEDKVMLSWNYEIHNQLYNSYFVERSIDGKTFSRLNDVPLTTLNNGNKTTAKRMFYIDSIANNTTYYYRIKGKTAFGELSPVSKIVSGKGETVLAYVPRITTKKYLDDKRIILGWEFLEEGNEHIKGFELNRSDKATGTYKVVLKNIPVNAREIQYDNLEATNYMTITAIGKKGNSRTSFPALVQPVDSVPPVRPVGFKGAIDSLGVVTLQWDANKEQDMLGYRVFRGNNKEEEYSQITVSPHQKTVYYDSISVKNLNANVYYQLVAVDQRFNASTPSEILALKKPDFIKPTQPVFTSYNIKDGNVTITWANSSSEDVIKHEIYRKEKGSADWKLVRTMGSRQSEVSSDQGAVGVLPTASLPTKKLSTISKPTASLPTENWTDTTVIEGQQYSYKIIATDDSALESDPSPLLTVVIPKTSLHPSLDGVNSSVDRNNGYIELYWKTYNQPGVAKLIIYKGLKGKAPSLMRQVQPNIKRIVDAKVKPNNEYVYILRAVFTDGSMSKIVKLNVKF